MLVHGSPSSCFCICLGERSVFDVAIVIPLEKFCKAVYSERFEGINCAHYQVLNGEYNFLVRYKQRYFVKLVCEMLIVVY